MPSRDWDKGNSLWIVTNLLDVVGDFRRNFRESLLTVWWFSGVHLVNTNDKLLDTKGESQESVFTSLSILGDTGFEFTNTSGDDKDGAISLGGTSNHVLGEITFTFGLEFVQNPGVFEGTFTHFLGFLLELFDSSLVDTTALVDQVTGSGRFTGIDVTDNDDVDVSLFFSHSEKFSIC